MSERLRVVIAEDNYLVREGTRRLLEDSGEVEVLASVSTAEELLEVVDGLRPDVVLLDLEMPELDGVEAIPQLLAAGPGLGVLVFTAYDTDDRVLGAIRAGARG